MNMNDVLKGRKKPRKRIGRGVGSGTGKTSGKGHGGQKSRSGARVHPMFEGGQMPLFRRLPKRGFSNHPFKRIYTAVNLDKLGLFESGETVSVDTLKEKGIVSGKKCFVKILAKGDVEKSLTFDVSAVSAKAREKIEARGGEIIEKIVEKPGKKQAKKQAKKEKT